MKCNKYIKIQKNPLLLILLRVFRPTREFFTHMETHPFKKVKRVKIQSEVYGVIFLQGPFSYLYQLVRSPCRFVESLS